MSSSPVLQWLLFIYRILSRRMRVLGIFGEPVFIQRYLIDLLLICYRIMSRSQIPDDKFRRSSEENKREVETIIDYAKLRQRRKSTPIKCREIYDVSNGPL